MTVVRATVTTEASERLIPAKIYSNGHHDCYFLNHLTSLNPLKGIVAHHIAIMLDFCGGQEVIHTGRFS